MFLFKYVKLTFLVCDKTKPNFILQLLKFFIGIFVERTVHFSTDFKK